MLAARHDDDIFTKGICLKVNIIHWLEFKLNCLEATIKHVNRYAIGTPLNWVVTPWKQSKTFYCAVDNSAVDHSRITRCFEKFHSGCKSLSNQTRPSRPETVDSKVGTPKQQRQSSTRRVSGELGIPLSCVIHHLHNLSRSNQLCFKLPKYCKTLDSSWIFIHTHTQIQRMFQRLSK